MFVLALLMVLVMALSAIYAMRAETEADMDDRVLSGAGVVAAYTTRSSR